jgi:hypothetical protein
MSAGWVAVYIGIGFILTLVMKRLGLEVKQASDYIFPVLAWPLILGLYSPILVALLTPEGWHRLLHGDGGPATKQ